MYKVYMSFMVAMGFLMCGLTLPKEAHAATFTQAFTNIKEIANEAGPALKTVFLAAGVGFVGLGIFKWVQSAKREEPKGPAMTMIVAGVFLLAIWTFAQAMSETMGLNQLDASW